MKPKTYARLTVLLLYVFMSLVAAAMGISAGLVLFLTSKVFYGLQSPAMLALAFGLGVSISFLVSFRTTRKDLGLRGRSRHTP